MARGKTSISLKGGKSDGVLIEDVAILKLADTLHVFSGSAFTEEPDGQVGIVVDLERPPKNWLSYKVSVRPTHLPGPDAKGDGVHLI